MAKQKDQAKVITRVFERDGTLLELSDTFVYECYIYKFNSNGVNLEDTKTTQSKKYVKDNTEYYEKDGVRFRKDTTLTKAPERWLKDNKYNERNLG